MIRYSSLYIYYISGTGNARKSAEWIADEARSAGIKAVLIQIDRLKDISFPSSSEDALLGFAFPTHGFNAAPIMLRFIASFPRGLAKDAFLLNTRAGMKLSRLFTPGLSGLSLILPAFMLRIKGYRITGYRPVDLPSNWIPLHPGIRKKVINSIFIRCEGIVRDFAGKIIKREKVFNGLLSLPVDLLISPLAIGYYFAGRFFLSKTFIANPDCNACGLCIKECPTSSIKLVRGRPYWKLTCESCMRCLNNCPLRAIEAAHGLAAGFLILIMVANTWITSLIISVLNKGTDSQWVKILSQVSSLALTVAIPAFIYLLLHQVAGFRPLSLLLKYTSLTTYRFWRRYKPGKID